MEEPLTAPPGESPPDPGGRPEGGDVVAELRLRLAERPVVLVGLMGAGKTTVGRRLAQMLALPFRDADHAIEAAAGMPIPDIFARFGEEYFRNGERRVIARLLEEGPMVLATGGGAFMNAETRERIAARAVSVWLRAELAVLVERVRKRSNRPLLQSTDPEGTMRRLMQERYPVYATADVTVDTRDISHHRVASEVILALHGWAGSSA